METSQTTDEKIGDIIYGTHLVVCHYKTQFNDDHDLVLRKDQPLIAGRGEGTLNWTRKETAPGGWKREVSMKLDTVSRDKSRATSKFEVVNITTEPVSSGRDAGYGGGPKITVKRLGEIQETISYTRRCHYSSDVEEPAILIMNAKTTDEKVGDIVYGAHLIKCHYKYMLDAEGCIVLCKDEPLVCGEGEIVAGSKKEMGERVVVFVNTHAYDLTRASSKFEVVSVETEILITDGNSKYGGGPKITVKRLDGDGELIVYTRECNSCSDIVGPVTLA